MSHPKPAWKFKAWSEAMLRGATVGDPEYKKTSGSKASRTTSRKRRKRRKRRKKVRNNAQN